MVRVHQRIHRHKMSDLLIAVDLVGLEKLPPGISKHHKPVLHQFLLHLIVQIKLPQIVNIA